MNLKEELVCLQANLGCGSEQILKKAPGASNPSPNLGFLLLPNCLVPGTKGSGERTFPPCFFSCLHETYECLMVGVKSHHPLPSNEEAHSRGASYTHQDGNLKLHASRSLWKSGSILFLVLKKEVCFFFVSSQLHAAADHIDTAFLTRDTCPLPEGKAPSVSFTRCGLRISAIPDTEWWISIYLLKEWLLQSASSTLSCI